MLGPSLAEPEPAWPQALLLGSVYALPYLFRCRAVMLSSIWVFGRVSLAWLMPVRPNANGLAIVTDALRTLQSCMACSTARAHAKSFKVLPSAALPMALSPRALPVFCRFSAPSSPWCCPRPCRRPARRSAWRTDQQRSRSAPWRPQRRTLRAPCGRCPPRTSHSGRSVNGCTSSCMCVPAAMPRRLIFFDGPR